VIDPPLDSRVALFTASSEKFNAMMCNCFPLTRHPTSIGGLHFTAYSGGFAGVASSSANSVNRLFCPAISIATLGGVASYLKPPPICCGK
jgi:hypothetical protein